MSENIVHIIRGVEKNQKDPVDRNSQKSQVPVVPTHSLSTAT